MQVKLFSPSFMDHIPSDYSLFCPATTHAHYHSGTCWTHMYFYLTCLYKHAKITSFASCSSSLNSSLAPPTLSLHDHQFMWQLPLTGFHPTSITSASLWKDVIFLSNNFSTFAKEQNCHAAWYQSHPAWPSVSLCSSPDSTAASFSLMISFLMMISLILKVCATQHNWHKPGSFCCCHAHWSFNICREGSILEFVKKVVLQSLWTSHRYWGSGN